MNKNIQTICFLLTFLFILLIYKQIQNNIENITNEQIQKIDISGSVLYTDVNNNWVLKATQKTTSTQQEPLYKI